RSGNAEAGLRLAAALWRFWEIRGHFHEGRQWLARVLDRAEANEPPAPRARALHGAGVLARNQGDYDTAQAFHEASLAIWSALEDRAGMAAALNALGLVARRRRDQAAARRFYE